MTARLDPIKIGFDPGPAGHVLKDTGSSSHWANYHSFECSCGYQIGQTLIKADGKISAAGRRQWRWHIDQVMSPPADEYIPIGVIEQARTRIEVYVVGREHPDAQSWDGNRQYVQYLRTPTGWQLQFPWMVCAKRTPTAKKSKRKPTLRIEGVARTKMDAAAQADTFLQRHNDRGYSIQRHDGADFTPPPMHPESSFVDMLNRVDKTIADGNLLEIQEILKEVNLVLGMVPVLNAKRDELQAAQAAEVERMLK